MSTETNTIETWAIVEIMGHTKLAGRVTEENHFGTVMLRLDIPDGNEFVTRFYGAAAIYSIAPTSEFVARAMATHYRPDPIYPYELPQLAPTTQHVDLESSTAPHERRFDDADDDTNPQDDEDDDEETA